jgi:hypothetical protein
MSAGRVQATRLHPTVENRLAEVARRWRSHRFLSAFADLLTATTAAFLILGFLTWRGWLTSLVAAVVLTLIVCVLAGAAFVVLVVAVSVSSPSRSALALALERVHPALLDRINTLVYLEAHAEAAPVGYARRGEAQAARSLVGQEIPSPFPGRLRWRRWQVFLATLLVTAAFLAATRPWRRLETPSQETRTASGAEPSLKLPEAATAEVEPPWGEVRITDPGRDLKVTKVDVVPLQIEAAANEPLTRARWSTAVGGAARQEHLLPAPREPHYAVYKPLLYVDELELSDWDVVSYFAGASTGPGHAYASEIYFLEVRPFREDILKLPGGEGGKAYRQLSELSGLIDRQKDVLRETHGFAQRTYADAAARTRDRRKLVEAETDLAAAARHLYGEIAALEHHDVAVVLDELARAQERLGQAARTLTTSESTAMPVEQEALAALVATRKKLQKAITDDPGAFGDDGGGEKGETSPVADLPDRLKKIAEFRNEDKAVREALARAVEEQKRIAERARSAPSAGLAEEEDRLRAAVEEMAQSHPRHFAGAKEQTKAAEDALGDAARSLREARGGDQAAARAQEAMARLRDTVARQSGAEQLGHAYALRDALEGQAKGLGKMAQGDGAEDAERAGATARQSRDATRELKKLVEETDVGEVFGPSLKETLGDERQTAREKTLDGLASAAGTEERKKAADAARQSLGEVTGAFDKSAPEIVRRLRSEDALKESDADAFTRALRQLEGLAEGDRAGRPPTPDDAKQRREALANLARGAQGRYGKDARMARVLVEVEQALEGEKVDAPRLRKLLDEIERFRVEMGDRRAAQEDKPELRHLDPSKLPPAYRARIERYFQKLSEQR